MATKENFKISCFEISETQRKSYFKRQQNIHQTSVIQIIERKCARLIQREDYKPNSKRPFFL